MPQAIDDEKMSGKPFMENGIMKMPLLQMEQNKPPLKSIPHLEFPRVLYRHPIEPFRVVEHRNAMHEIVDIEKIPSEHLTRVVACPEHLEKGAKECANCEAELAKALEDGWVKEPYLPKPLPDPNANLYRSRGKK